MVDVFLAFWLCWVCTEARGLLVAVHGGFSSCGTGPLCRCGAWALEYAGSVAVARGLSCLMSCDILVLRPGIEPVSPALEGGF